MTLPNEAERRLTATEVTLSFIKGEMARERELLCQKFDRDIQAVKEEVQEERERIKTLEERVAYYDKAAVKYGTVAIVVVSIGAYLSAASDKMRDLIVKLVHAM